MVDNLITLVALTGQTATFTSTPVSLPKSGLPRRGINVRAIVDNVSTTTPTASTLSLAIQVSRDGSTTWITYTNIRNTTSLTSDNITAAGEYYGHLHAPDVSATGATYPQLVRVVGTIAGSAPSFDVQCDFTVSKPG